MRSKRRCKECGERGDHQCARCENWRCWAHLKARKAPRSADAYYLVCRGECRLRQRARCTALSPTGRRCVLPGYHDGAHQLHGHWIWFDGAEDYLPRAREIVG